KGLAVERGGKIVATVTTSSYRFFGEPEALGKIKPNPDIFSAFERLREGKLQRPEATVRHEARSLHEENPAELEPSKSPAGASLDCPCRLGPLHPSIVEAVQKLYLVALFGLENRDWFEEGRTYHNNRTVCEQRVRLKNKATSSVFFDRSEINFTRTNAASDSPDLVMTVVHGMYALATKGSPPP